MGLSPKDSLNLFFMLVSTALIAWGPMVHERGGPGNTFTYHPFMMGLGFCLLITLGFWMFNYEELPGEWINSRASRRQVHAICQISGVVCIAAGYAAVARAHVERGAGLLQVSNPPMGFSFGPNWVRLLHIIVGYFALFLLVVQVSVGVLKYRVVADDDVVNDRTFSIHEQIGGVLYLCGLGNVVLGVWLWEAWSLPLRIVISLALLTSLAFGPRWDGTRGFLTASDQTAPPQQGHRQQHHERRGGHGGSHHGGQRGSEGSSTSGRLGGQTSVWGSTRQ